MGGGAGAGALIPRLAAATLAVAVALLAGATAADLAGAWSGAPLLWRSGARLEAAGVAVGALAIVLRAGSLALPGARRRRAGWGLALLLAALLLFALARWVRGDAAIPPDPALLLAEPLTTALLLAGARIGRPAPPTRAGEPS